MVTAIVPEYLTHQLVIKVWENLVRVLRFTCTCYSLQNSHYGSFIFPNMYYLPIFSLFTSLVVIGSLSVYCYWITWLYYLDYNYAIVVFRFLVLRRGLRRHSYRYVCLKSGFWHNASDTCICWNNYCVRFWFQGLDDDCWGIFCLQELRITSLFLLGLWDYVPLMFVGKNL